MEITDEALLFYTQYIGVAMLKPIKHLPEVVQVIERIVEGICSHRENGPWRASTGYAYRYQLRPTRCKWKRINGDAICLFFRCPPNFLLFHGTNRLRDTVIALFFI
jgi:hypothetical protein